MLNVNFPANGMGLVSPPHFLYDFLKKNVTHVILNLLTKFHCLIDFTF